MTARGGPRGEVPPGKPERLRALLPHAWELVAPRMPQLVLGGALMLVGRAAGLVMPASTKVLVDDVVGRHRGDLLVPLAAAVAAASLVQALSTYALTQLLSRGAHRLVADLRKKVQAHLGRLPLPYYDAHKTGTLVARVMADVEGLRNLVGTGLVDLAGGAVTAVIALGVLVVISPALTAMSVALLAAFGTVLGLSLRWLRPMFRERGKIYSEVAGRLTESLGGVRVVKGYRAEAREADVFSVGAERILGNVLRTLRVLSLMGLGSTAFLGLVAALVMALGGRQILDGTMTLGAFLTFGIFLGYLVSPVFQVVATGTAITEALAGLERTREVLRERPEDEDPGRTVSLPALEGRVAFDGVSFGYDDAVPVLHDVSFVAEPGTVTALVGPSGAGKSTVIGLVAGFYAPTRGTVAVDGVDLSSVRLQTYRAQLGVVLQETFLFDGTIRENVAFSRPEAPEEQILRACRLARVDEFAEGFERRYDTVVGERGVKLSGGQKQRVSIARAILADPRILILDEATSSLDSESEGMIQDALGLLMRDRTTFVIAHRLSTVRRAHQILVLDAGRIVERGTHDELLARGGRYHDLYTRQHGRVEELFGLPEATDDDDATPAEERPDDLPGPLRLLGSST